MPPAESKSAKKRRMLALQTLGENLTTLPPETVRDLPIDDALKQAVLDAIGMSAHGALRRQRQLIGKLMRQLDPGPIEAAFQRATKTERDGVALFKRAERWRDKLISDGATAWQAWVAEFGSDPAVEDCLRDLRKTIDDGKEKALRRRLFQLVRERLDKHDAE